MLNNNSAQRDLVHSKTLFRFSKLTDKLLRKLEQSEKMGKVISKSLASLDQSQEGLACMTIRNGLLAMNLGYLKASDAIPRLLDVVSRSESQKVEQEFITYSKDTPTWVFLRWIGQLVAVINRNESSIIAEKIRQLARKYP